MTAARTEVGWDDDAKVRAWPGRPPLGGDTAPDACVVGLGASGLAAVEELEGRGLDVVGVDAGRVAAGAAGRNGGFLVGGGAPSLHDALDRWGSCALDLYRATLDELDRLDRRLPGTVRRVGSIRLAGLPGRPDPAEQDDCATHLETLHRHGIAAQEYAGALGTGVVLPDDAAVNPAVRALGLAARTTARLHENTRVAAIGSGRVVTEHGTIHAGTVIVAVDGRLDVLLPQLADLVHTVRLQMIATVPVPPVLACPVYCRWGYDYAQQLPDGRLFVGGGRDRAVDAERTTDTAPSDEIQRYLDELAGTFAGRPVDVTHRWAASVGYTDDERALCVEVEPGVVATGGYSGTGNLVGPVAARAAVALALDGTAPPAYLNDGR